ncbi:MAG: NAD(P)/FAD-dependent oxidoreductase [Acidobacteria bacterium]|nr:NAD(P)/FAD-dependent oxidoreductase [Acidobacteriota bacterium]MBU4307009.1 NAD(P)/FAD-dependent oxidoreductase [Acidobacteriota bacterium]MBU4404250.1 NAD(P)/FAD-dependent oxidoreductase [Acidobacteriota bacterium]MCG2812801.1 NAD(P)/FAD-dependent oxidoreductase [Candidatus Aminicenantes bacterium]
MRVARVAVIGAGPAGMAAAIQLKRYGISPLLFEKNQIGGLLLNANRVDNYPGFPRGISGPELVYLFRKQLKGMSIDVTIAKVEELDFKKNEFRFSTNDREYSSKMVLLASGTEAMIPEELSALAEWNRKIFSEIRSLRGKQNKKIAIIGAGDAAFDYALSLARKNEVIILNRSANRKCSPELWREALKSSGISYLNNVRISRVGFEKRRQVVIDYRQQLRNGALEVDFLVAACGRRMQLDCLSKNLSRLRVQLEQNGLLYFAGDVANGSFRQVGIAVGDGIRAAMKMVQKLSGARI